MKYAAHDQWTIEMSLRNEELLKEYCEKLLDQRKNALLRMNVDDVTFYALLHRMVLSHSAHEWYDEDLVHLYYDYLKEIVKADQISSSLRVSRYLIWDI